MDIDKMKDGVEVSDSEAASKIKAKKRDSIADVTLDIKSRLSLETTEACGEPHVNGIAQVNGICDSPQRTAAVTDLSSQSKTMETSHLNQHGIQCQLIRHVQYRYDRQAPVYIPNNKIEQIIIHLFL